MKETIRLSKAEIQSGLSRGRFAEKLILELPNNHEGRNTWLLNFGVGEFAQSLRNDKGLEFTQETQSCESLNK